MVDMLLNDKSAEDPVTPTDGAGERQSATLTQSVYAQLRADVLSGRMRRLNCFGVLRRRPITASGL